MSADPKTPAVLTLMGVGFLGLSGLFRLGLWGRVEPPAPVPLVAAEFTNTATVRVSAAQLLKTGGDTSGLECYTCHEKDKPPKLKLDANGDVVLPKEHEDLVMRHGRNKRNDNCYNCHDPENLPMLRTRDGRQLKIEESTQLCGSCHGPTYRDWEAGIHGRTSGHWNRPLGAITRQGCADCHAPHAPAFPELKPAPGPHALHPVPEPAGAHAPGH